MFLRHLTRAGRRAAFFAKLPGRLAQEWPRFRPTRVMAAGPATAGTLGIGASIADVECARCPMFARFPARCRVPIGSRIRACVCASTEYHLHGVRGKTVLEIGCGESSYARTVVEAAGGRWIGCDPRTEKDGRRSVRAVAGRVAALPFADASVDVVAGVQTLEHWEEGFEGAPGLAYARSLAEIWRVLRPGGELYLDAPIHLHGAPPFVRGDLAAIERIFATQPWSKLEFTSWRRRHAPLRAHRAPARESERWARVLPNATEAEIAALARATMWLLSIRAQKPAS